MLSRLANRARIDREQGFTLIEILIVIAILLTLSAIAVPFYLSAVQRGYVTSLTSDVVQTATRFSLVFTDTCGQDHSSCTLPNQATFTSSVKVASNSNNQITAYVYKPAAITTSPNAEQNDANDYYADGIVCVQGVNTTQITPGQASDPVPTGNTTWSYWLVLGQGSGLTAVKSSGEQAPSTGSNNIHQGPCDATTSGAPSSYLNTNQALLNALTSNWSVTNIYS